MVNKVRISTLEMDGKTEVPSKRNKKYKNKKQMEKYNI